VGIHKLMSGLVRIIAKDVFEDSVRAARWVMNSGLDWIIPRAPMLRDGPVTGDYHVGFVNGELGNRLARGNFADFILKQVDRDEWLHKMPAVSDG